MADSRSQRAWWQRPGVHGIGARSTHQPHSKHLFILRRRQSVSGDCCRSATKRFVHSPRQRALYTSVKGLET